ncbi:MAG: hypothetical protein ACW96U_08855, partial [Candidatus Heimdallarchaeaceae archaeon]
KSKGAQKIRVFSRPEYGYIPELLEKWGFEKVEETGKRIILSAKDFADKEFAKPDYFHELDLNDDKGLAKFKKFYLKARTEVTEENFDQTMKTFRERNLTIACVVAKKDEALSYGLLYKADQPKRSFLSSIPVFNKDHKYILKEMVVFMANKALKEGYEEIYHGLVDEENEKLYKKIGIEFTPSFRYELKLD